MSAHAKSSDVELFGTLLSELYDFFFVCFKLNSIHNKTKLFSSPFVCCLCKSIHGRHSLRPRQPGQVGKSLRNGIPRKASAESRYRYGLCRKRYRMWLSRLTVAFKACLAGLQESL